MTNVKQIVADTQTGLLGSMPILIMAKTYVDQGIYMEVNAGKVVGVGFEETPPPLKLQLHSTYGTFKERS